MKSFYKKVGFLILTAATAAATAFAIFNRGIKKLDDVRYGSYDAQKLDIYLPRSNKSQCTAVVVYIHGGAWSMGDKADHDADCCREAKKGYAAATINYRMIGDGATWVDMLEDITAAIDAIQATASENGIILRKAALTGVSAGAHLAMLYSYKNQDISPIEIVFCGNQCGPSNFIDNDVVEKSGDSAWVYSVLSELIGKKLDKNTFNDLTEPLKDASPLTYITKDSPPTIIAHGQKDDVVPYSQGLDVYKAFNLVEGVCELVPYPNSGHSLSSDPDAARRYEQLFSAFEALYFGY